MSDEVARQLYPIILGQARDAVVLQVGLLILWGGFIAVDGISGRFSAAAGLFLAGLAVAVLELRWLQWLRGATPRQAYVRMQAREEPRTVVQRSPWTFGTLLAAFAIWLIVEGR